MKGREGERGEERREREGGKKGEIMYKHSSSKPNPCENTDGE